jgi:hypothetical protein
MCYAGTRVEISVCCKGVCGIDDRVTHLYSSFEAVMRAENEYCGRSQDDAAELSL